MHNPRTARVEQGRMTRVALVAQALGFRPLDFLVRLVGAGSRPCAGSEVPHALEMRVSKNTPPACRTAHPLPVEIGISLNKFLNFEP